MVKTVTREIEVVDNEQLLAMGATGLSAAMDLLRYYRDQATSEAMSDWACNILQIIEDASSHIEHYIELINIK